VAPATFAVLAAGTPASSMMVLAQRLRRELDEAKVTYREQPLKFVTSLGIASSAEAAATIEDLIRLALKRLQPAQRPASAPEPRKPAGGLPPDLERVLRFLESTDLTRLGDAAELVAKRLKRIAKAIQARRR